MPNPTLTDEGFVICSQGFTNLMWYEIRLFPIFTGAKSCCSHAENNKKELGSYKEKTAGINRSLNLLTYFHVIGKETILFELVRLATSTLKISHLSLHILILKQLSQHVFVLRIS